MFQDDPRWALAGSTRWTREEDKLFEQALVSIPDGLPERWEMIALRLPGKSVADVAAHYHDLVHDVREIDAGRVELPSYADDSATSPPGGGGGGWDSTNQISFGTAKTKQDPDRKKGTPWTEQEHKLFLKGLQQYGKGDWRSISRNVVITRTPTQVASHAQKYYIRQCAGKKERKRSSIHDITTVDSNLVPAQPPADQSNFIQPPASNPPSQQMPPPSFHQQLNQPQPLNVMPNHGGQFGYQTSYGFPM